MHKLFDLIWLIWFIVLNATYSNISIIMATSFSGERSRSTRREPLTMGKQLVNYIIAGARRVYPFCHLQSRARTHVVLVIGLYDELLGNPTIELIGLTGPSNCLKHIENNHEGLCYCIALCVRSHENKATPMNMLDSCRKCSNGLN